MGADNAYMNEYMKRRWQQRRAAAIEHLGGRCVMCGTTDTLEFDHKDPRTKKFALAKGSGYSELRFWTEVQKCQLLCNAHHKEKTAQDRRLHNSTG